MANLLVTGGAGFIGTNFVRYWRNARPADPITVLDALTYAGRATNLEGIEGVDLVVGDICDIATVETLLGERDIDTIVHFAAETHVDRSISGPDAFVHTNIVGTHSLLKAARKSWLDVGSGRPHRFHNVSTDEVYGSLGPTDPPFTEATPYSPNSPYSASKAAADHLVRSYNQTYGLETTTSHCSNNYGPYQFPEKLIPLFLRNALIGEPLPIYGDGLNVRDWLHVDDHCRAIALIIAHGISGETYNIGGGQELPNIAIVDEICQGVDLAFARLPELSKHFPNAFAANSKPTADLKAYVDDRQGHDRRYAINDEKLRNTCGYMPSRDFAEGLAATLDWYVENEAWWRSVR